jgi:O-antigen ligase
MVFASGDIWPVVTIGFTFRFSQLCALLALLLIAAGAPDMSIRRFPGALWLYAFVTWIFIMLPFSLYIERSAAYALWTLMDVLMIATFVQYFGTARRLPTLIHLFVLSFVILAIFGCVQFAAGLAGIDLFVRQWWVPGRLARINGISYEPSYYATYLIVGWVLSCYLLEKGALAGHRRLLRVCAFTSTVALLLSSSRLGWLLMSLWVLTRAALFVYRTLFRGKLSYRSANRIGVAVTLLAMCGVLIPLFAEPILDSAENLTFLLSGLGVSGQAAHSTEDREHSLEFTVQAFLAHPLIGSGIGAVSVEIAAQNGAMVSSIEDAKKYDGFSLFTELLASTGVVGTAFLVMFVVALSKRIKVLSSQVSEFHRYLLRGLAWSMVWIVIAMQFNQNFLRLYIFVDLSVLLTCMVALTPTASRFLARG